MFNMPVFHSFDASSILLSCANAGKCLQTLLNATWTGAVGGKTKLPMIENHRPRQILEIKQRISEERVTNLFSTMENNPI